MPWHVLASVGVLFAIAEIFTTSFVLLPAGLAFIATAVWSLFFPGWTPLLAILSAHLFLTYAFFYYFVWPKLARSAPKSAVSGMTGQIATVTDPITANGETGYVKLYGDSWRAISDRAFAVGEKVTILRIDGNKVVVGPVS